MITNRMTGEWVRLMADIEHEPEFVPIEQPLPGLLHPQALDLPAALRERLALEFATGASIHV